MALINSTAALRLAYDPSQGLLAGTQFGFGPDVEEIQTSTRKTVSEVPVNNIPYAVTYDPSAGAFIEGGQNGAIDWFPATSHPPVLSLGVLGDGAIEAATDVGGGQALLVSQNGTLLNFDIAGGLLQNIVLPGSGFPYSVAFDSVNDAAMVVDPVANADYLLAGNPSRASPPLTVTSLTEVPANATVQEPFQVDTFAIGGSPPYAYDYSGLPASCPPANTATLLCGTGQAGSYLASVRVTDSVGNTAYYSTDITIIQSNATSLPLVTVAFSPDPAAAGALLRITVSVSGSPPVMGYTYQGLPPGCQTTNSSVLVCVPTQPGTYQVSVLVTYDGGQSYAAQSIEVFPASTGPAEPTNLIQTWFWLVVIILIVAVAVVGLVLFLAFRPRPPSQPPPLASTVPPPPPIAGPPSNPGP